LLFTHKKIPFFKTGTNGCNILNGKIRHNEAKENETTLVIAIHSYIIIGVLFLFTIGDAFNAVLSSLAIAIIGCIVATSSVMVITPIVQLEEMSLAFYNQKERLMLRSAGVNIIPS
jgi:hypothetical protein